MSASDRDALLRFAREWQLAAGACVPPVDVRDVLCASLAALRSIPRTVPTEAQPHVVRAVAALGRRVLRLEEAARASLDNSDGGGRARIALVLDRLLTLYSDKHLRLWTLAALVGCTPSHVCRQIRLLTGDGYVTHVAGVRILAASALLASTELSIDAIAGRVGYHHTGELDRGFRRWLPVSARRFRQLARPAP
jgi:AraC-like DNA-binding protein